MNFMGKRPGRPPGRTGPRAIVLAAAVAEPPRHSEGMASGFSERDHHAPIARRIRCQRLTLSLGRASAMRSTMVVGAAVRCLVMLDACPLPHQFVRKSVSNQLHALAGAGGPFAASTFNLVEPRKPPAYIQFRSFTPW
jgi:hypothetical protein